MAGFLDKKKRLIDYKLTDYGRQMLSKGSINFKYYTFSDSSIFYNRDFDEEKINISDSLKYYMPFEVDTRDTVLVNASINLDKVVKYSDYTSNRLLLVKNSFTTTTDYLLDKKYIDDKKFNGSLTNEINFKYKDTPVEFDFENSNYPTLKYNEEDITSLPIIKNDKRFDEKLKCKTLVPVGIESVVLQNPSVIDDTAISNIFKSFSVKTFNLLPNDSRAEVIDKALYSMSLNDSFYRLEYEINEDNKKENDLYLLELHEVKIGDNLNPLEKVVFFKLTEYLDRRTNKFKKVYLGGKFILVNKSAREFNKENNQKKKSLSREYVFVNMFTLVIE